jgi:hypothetical protein
MQEIDFDISLHDPSTTIQRPSSNKVPDTTHVLTKTFGY